MVVICRSNRQQGTKTKTNKQMILKEIFYAVKCNRCGTLHGGSDYSYFIQESDAVESAMDSEWCEYSGKHYCPYCFTFTDEDQEEVKIKEPYPDHLTKLKKFLEKVLNVRARVFEHPDSFIVKINIYSSKILIPIDERYVFEILGDHFISNEREDKRYGEVEYTVTIKK